MIVLNILIFIYKTLLIKVKYFFKKCKMKKGVTLISPLYKERKIIYKAPLREHSKPVGIY